MCSNCLVPLSGVLWSEPGQRAGHLEVVFMWVGFVYSPGNQDWLALGTHFRATEGPSDRMQRVLCRWGQRAW